MLRHCMYNKNVQAFGKQFYFHKYFHIITYKALHTATNINLTNISENLYFDNK